jgi:hypothetical protein
MQYETIYPTNEMRKKVMAFDFKALIGKDVRLDRGGQSLKHR